MLALLLRSALLGGWLTVPAIWLPGTAELRFDDLAYGDLRLGRTTLQIESVTADSVVLRLDSAVLSVGEQTFGPVTLSCDARRQLTAIICGNGDLSLSHAVLGQLQAGVAFHYHFDRGLQYVAVDNMHLAGGRIDFKLRPDGAGWQGDLELHDVELGDIQALVDEFTDIPALSGLADVKGRLSAVAEATGIGATPEIRAEWQLAGLNYSADTVLQDLGSHGTLAAGREHDDWRLNLAINVDAGELYLVPPLDFPGTPPGIYIAVPETGLSLSTEASVDAGLWQITVHALRYEHPGVLELDASALLTPGSDDPLTALTMHVPPGDVSAAFSVYVQPWLLDSIYNDLDVRGRAGITLELGHGDLLSLALSLDDVTVIDNAGRFALQGVTTELTVQHDRSGYSQMRWRAIDLYRLSFGAGAIGIASDGLDLRVTEWRDVPIYDGLLHIDQLDISGLGTPDFSVRMAGALAPMSLRLLTEALEWPPFGGTLGGEFTGLSYRNGDLETAGRWRVQMFDGEVNIHGLRVRDLLGRLPVLEAEISVDDIDLERLTDTFAFGKITGRLSGRIEDLRLVNWQPVTFYGELSTLGDKRGRHRISQKALNNISQIGGGLRGALSRGFLQYFDEYSYGDLGISCRLARGYCELGGVRATEDGHYILTRGGLLPPWVEVRLSGTMVAWDTLIEGFRTIAAGDVVIE